MYHNYSNTIYIEMSIYINNIYDACVKTFDFNKRFIQYMFEYINDTNFFLPLDLDDAIETNANTINSV